VLLICIAFCSSALAAPKKSRKKNTRSKSRSHAVHRARPPVVPYMSALVLDAQSGKVLFEKNPDLERAPASLTKMMTELLALEALDRGIVSLSDTIVVPSEVKTIGGSRLRLRAGERLCFDDALRAMVIASANDAAFTVAHHISGSESAFVTLMNLRARELGMGRTRFVNSHGLDRKDIPGSVTTARDLALLGRKLLEHPMSLQLSSTQCDTVRHGQVIHSTNRLLGMCHGADGLKTGYTGKAGFCLVGTAERDGLRLISVVLGASSNRRRFSESAGILNKAFADFVKVPVIRKGQDLDHPCAMLGGSPPQVRLVAGEDVAVVLPARLARAPITLRVDAPKVGRPPIREGSPLGNLVVLVGDSLAAQAPAVAARSVRRANLFDRLGQVFH